MYRLFLVEDDRGIAAAVTRQAEAWGLETVCTVDFRNVTGEFAAAQPHLVLLDITLPYYDGYHWCRELRRISTVPIIFLSSAADNMNILMAMNLGADDFIAKPFDFSVLMAKVQAMLRRAYDQPGKADGAAVGYGFLCGRKHPDRQHQPPAPQAGRSRAAAVYRHPVRGGLYHPHGRDVRA